MRIKKTINKRPVFWKWLAGFFAIYLAILGLTNTGYADTNYEIPVVDTEFVNEDTIEQDETVGNDQTLATVYGVYGPASGLLELFNNTVTGVISASGEAGDAVAGDATITELAGVYIDRDVTTFENAGTISATANIGTAAGNGMSAQIRNIYGTRLGGTTSSFNNSGNILVTVTGGDAAGNVGGMDLSRMILEQVYGTRFESGVSSFNNANNITVTATAGSATGIESGVQIRHLYGARFESTVDSFSNTGDISVTATAGDEVGNDSSVYVAEIYGIRFDGNVGSFNNTGTISVVVEAGDGALVENVAAIYLDGSTATISNPGAIYLSTNKSDADIRAFWLENSDLTLSEQVSLPLGGPGITKKPIYVDGGSTLDLNNVDLIAIAGTSLDFDSAYDLISNDGTVSNEFDSLLRGHANPEIAVSWQNSSDKGESAAVIFSYQPTPEGSVAGIGTSASRVLASNISKGLLMNAGFKRTLGSRFDKDIWAMVDELLNPKPEHKNTVFIYPFYTEVSDRGIGFSADAAGITLGFEHELDKETTAGLFAGITPETKINYKQGSGKDKPDIYSWGAYLDYAPHPRYVRLAFTGYAANHDYQGLTGPDYGVSENASYWSRGLDSELSAGYIFGEKDWQIMPEFGLGYSCWWTQGFSTNAAESNWNRHFQRSQDGYLKATGTVTAVKSLMLGNTKLNLFLSLQAERALTENDITISQSIPGLSTDVVSIKQSIANTTFAGSLGANFTLKDRLQLNLSLRSDLNSDYRTYTGKLSLTTDF